MTKKEIAAVAIGVLLRYKTSLLPFHFLLTSCCSFLLQPPETMQASGQPARQPGSEKRNFSRRKQKQARTRAKFSESESREKWKVGICVCRGEEEEGTTTERDINKPRGPRSVSSAGVFFVIFCALADVIASRSTAVKGEVISSLYIRFCRDLAHFGGIQYP